LQRLLDISAEILGQLDIDRLMESIMTGAADLLDASQINLYRYAPDLDALRAWINLRAPEGAAHLVLRRGEGLAGAVLATGQGQRIDDYDNWEGRSLQWPPGVTGASMAVPLRRGADLLGVITVARPPRAAVFSASDLDLLQLFANQAAVAITNARLYAQAERRSREFSHLYDTSLDITAKLDLKDVLESVIRRTRELVEAQQGEVLVFDEDTGLVTVFLSLGLEEVGVPGDIHRSGQPPSGLDGIVIREQRPVRVEDYDSWEHRISGEGRIGPMIGVPILHQGRILGSFSLARAPKAGPFTDEDERRLVLFANQAAVAVANARQVALLEKFHAQQIERERLDQQLRTARAVQAGLLPAELPAISGWDLAARWRPALQLGGDYYDVIPLDRDQWGVLVADVSDKGIPAALLMAVARSLFRVYASADLSPSDTLRRINHNLVASSHSGMFVTAVYAVADTRSGEIRLSAAGHPPAMQVRQPDQQVEFLRVPGMPLGILDEAEFGERSVRLQPGDGLVLYTDGTTEASDAAGDQFGPRRLQDVLARSRAASARTWIAEIDEAVHAFVGETPASDDVAYLAVRRRDESSLERGDRRRSSEGESG